MAVFRIGEPRRHDFLADHALDARRHRAYLIVGDEREWAAFARAVAGLAIFLEDRRNVFGEGGRLAVVRSTERGLSRRRIRIED